MDAKLHPCMLERLRDDATGLLQSKQSFLRLSECFLASRE